jgi:hypothetical protein
VGRRRIFGHGVRTVEEASRSNSTRVLLAAAVTANWKRPASEQTARPARSVFVADEMT